MQSVPALPDTAPPLGEVVPFPGGFSRHDHNRPRGAASPADRMTFTEVAREMCLDWHKRNDQIIGKLRSMYRHMAMPLPENPRFRGGVPCKGADNICAASIWSRRKFMAWKDGGRGNSAAPPAAAHHGENRMARNAARLAGAGQ